jgi:hypothetical protein
VTTVLSDNHTVQCLLYENVAAKTAQEQLP